MKGIPIKLPEAMLQVLAAEAEASGRSIAAGRARRQPRPGQQSTAKVFPRVIHS
jgi:hypothetical protein